LECVQSNTQSESRGLAGYVSPFVQTSSASANYEPGLRKFISSILSLQTSSWEIHRLTCHPIVTMPRFLLQGAVVPDDLRNVISDGFGYRLCIHKGDCCVWGTDFDQISTHLTNRSPCVFVDIKPRSREAFHRKVSIPMQLQRKKGLKHI